MIEFTSKAERQLDGLRQHYLTLARAEALRNLEAAIFEAAAEIERNPAAGLPNPRPYPQLARQRRLWLKAGRYWFTYRTAPTVAITGVYYESANIPKRL